MKKKSPSGVGSFKLEWSEQRFVAACNLKSLVKNSGLDAWQGKKHWGHWHFFPDNCVVHLFPRRSIMSRAVRNCFLFLFYTFISIPGGIAFAQGNTEFENARQLNQQEIIDLIANKTVRYRITVGSRTDSDVNVEMNKITFTKTEKFGGNLSAFSTGSSTDGKWYVNDKSRLIRQYDRVAWGNKPFGVGVFENKGKYYWKIGEVFQELLSIE